MCTAMVAERAETPAVVQAPASEPVVRIEGLNHYYGEGEARNQGLFDNRSAVAEGWVVAARPRGPGGAGGAPRDRLEAEISVGRRTPEGRDRPGSGESPKAGAC